MTLTLGDYLRNQRPQWADSLTDVQHMDVQKPLVAKSKGKGPQRLRCRVILDCTIGKAAVEFYSVTPEGKKLTKHAECTITFPNAKVAVAEYQDNSQVLLHRMAELRKNLDHDDRVQKLNRSSGYKLVASLAQYDDEFKGVEEVILDITYLLAQMRAASRASELNYSHSFETV